MNKKAIEQLQVISKQINQTIENLKNQEEETFSKQDYNHLNSLCNELATKNISLQEQVDHLQDINKNLQVQLEVADKESQTMQYYESLISKLDQEKSTLKDNIDKLKQENDQLNKELDSVKVSPDMKKFEKSISAVIRLFDHIPINSKTFSDFYSILSLHKDEDPIYPYLLNELKSLEHKTKESAFRKRVESDPLMSQLFDIIYNKGNDNEIFWI